MHATHKTSITKGGKEKDQVNSFRKRHKQATVKNGNTGRKNKKYNRKDVTHGINALYLIYVIRTKRGGKGMENILEKYLPNASI